MRGRVPRIARVLAAALALAAGGALAQERPDPGAAERGAELQARGVEAFNRGDYARAEALFQQECRETPDNFVPYYNLACARAMQGDPAGAAAWLEEAIKRGFVDVYQLERDTNFRSVRGEPVYRRLVENWSGIIAAHRDANQRIATELFDAGGPTYTVLRNEDLRVVYLSAFDPGSFKEARGELDRIAAWGLSEIFTDLAPAEGKANFDPWVVVVLPTQEAFLKWALITYGPGAISGVSGVGGAYNHDTKRLIAQDLGATLRHEFFHVLHWRSATRLGQDHPVWIQEGLCSLVEDYRLEGDTVAPIPSWRTNMVKRRLKGGSLMPIKTLASLPRERFVGSSPLAYYAQSRAIFLYLHGRGKLGAWYREYTEGYGEDPTGVRAIEEVLGQEIGEVDRDFKAWVRALPEVADMNRPGRAGIGVEVEPGAGDGPVISEVTGRSAAGKAGLRLGDVITAIDGQPTRDWQEMLRVLGEYKVGDEVEVRYRRGSLHGSVRMRLTTRG